MYFSFDSVDSFYKFSIWYSLRTPSGFIVQRNHLLDHPFCNHSSTHPSNIIVICNHSPPPPHSTPYPLKHHGHSLTVCVTNFCKGQSKWVNSMLRKYILAFLIQPISAGRTFPHLLKPSLKPSRNRGIWGGEWCHLLVENLFGNWKEKIFSSRSFRISQNLLHLLCLQLSHLSRSWIGLIEVGGQNTNRQFLKNKIHPEKEENKTCEHRIQNTWTKAGWASWLCSPLRCKIFASFVVFNLTGQEAIEQLNKGSK